MKGFFQRAVSPVQQPPLLGSPHTVWGGAFLSLKSRQTLSSKLKPGFCPFSSELEPRPLRPGNAPRWGKLRGDEGQRALRALWGGGGCHGQHFPLAAKAPALTSFLSQGICPSSLFWLPLGGPQKLQTVTNAY